MTMGRSIEEIAQETGVPIENFHPPTGGLHLEIIDTSSMQVWQTMADVTLEQYKALKVEPPYREVGIGNGQARLSAHTSYFTRSPDAEQDGPMEKFEYGGLVWSNCARPADGPEHPAGPDGPVQMRVQKHHHIVYAAGSDISYLHTPDDEWFVQVIEGLTGEAPAVSAEGWELRTVRTEKELIFHLPCPSTVFFFRNFDSWQGPVSAPV